MQELPPVYELALSRKLLQQNIASKFCGQRS